MSAEPRRVKTGYWADWENHVVNGVFPLRRFLGRSNHSTVFLTEYAAGNLPNAAIKLIPADTVQAEAVLVQWGTAATVSHPGLLRLLDMGRWQFGGRGFLYVVMEYAEQTLAQILPRRALSPDEVSEMLAPTLDALAFVHRNSLVHSQLKPSNILVVDDRLKLATDTIRAAGRSATGIVRSAAYDSPELKEGEVSAAGDVWSLGMTLIEALTQRGPPWPDERSAIASLSPILPPPLVDTVWRCLIRNPTHRPSAADLSAEYKPATPAPATPDPPPVVSEAPAEDSPPRKSPTWPLLLTAAAAALVISLAVWVDSRPPNSQQVAQRSTQASEEPAAEAPTSTADDDEPSEDEVPAGAAHAAPNTAAETEAAPALARTSAPAPTLAPAPARARPQTPTFAQAPAVATRTANIPNARETLAKALASDVEPSAPPPTATSGSVLHEEIPEAPQNILKRIHGHVKVTVRVLVDPAGDVVGQFMENSGPSRYFARLAGDASGAWKFAPADDRGPRVWLLQFEFTRGGATVRAADAH